MSIKCKAIGHDGVVRNHLNRAMGAILVLASLCGCVFHHKQVGASFLDDKVTTERVEAALKTNPEFRQVHVSTNDREVTMTGSVKNDAIKQKAAEVAKTVDTVTSVRNELQVH